MIFIIHTTLYISCAIYTLDIFALFFSIMCNLVGNFLGLGIISSQLLRQVSINLRNLKPQKKEDISALFFYIRFKITIIILTAGAAGSFKSLAIDSSTAD